jgi:hypothetical protein
LTCVLAELSSKDEPALATALLQAVSDRRYIASRTGPSFGPLPGEACRDPGRLRRRADQGIGSPFLIARRTSASDDSFIASLAEFCDAALDLPGAPLPEETGQFSPLDKNGVDIVPYRVIAMQGVARAQKARAGAYPLYHTVTLGRDNTAQRPERPLVYTRFHVRDYRRWLDAAIASARDAHAEDRRFVFVNAWNAWNEFFPERRHSFRQGDPCPLEHPRPAMRSFRDVPNYTDEPFRRRRLDILRADI